MLRVWILKLKRSGADVSLVPGAVRDVFGRDLAGQDLSVLVRTHQLSDKSLDAAEAIMDDVQEYLLRENQSRTNPNVTMAELSPVVHAHHFLFSFPGDEETVSNLKVLITQRENR